jgi:hypothetical protein
MRQIDNMSSSEIDTLHLKGMLAERRTVPADKPTAIETSQPWTPERQAKAIRQTKELEAR